MVTSAVIVFSSTMTTLLNSAPSGIGVAPERKFVPVMVTEVVSPIGSRPGMTEVTVNAGTVLMNTAK